MIVCVCNNVSDKAIAKAVEENGVRSYIQLQRATETGTCCGKCTSCAKQVLKDSVEAYEEKMLTDLQDLAFA